MCLLAGCVTPGADFDALPFYRRDRVGETPEGQGPKRTETSQETLSPIVLARDKRSQDGGKVRLTWPYPFMIYKERGVESSLRFLLGIPAIVASTTPAREALGLGAPFIEAPIYGFATDHVDHDGNIDEDRGILPFFAYGSSKDEGDYTVVAPFGGTTKGLLGKDEMHWWGFPLPLYLWSRDDDFESRHILPPFINWVEGEGRSGWRVWPFYAHYERKDEQGKTAYDRSWVMWPFVTWQTNGANLTTRDEAGKVVPVPPTKVFAVLPFYGSVKGPEIDEIDLLYPLFRYTTKPRDKAWELRAPFPFVILGGDEAGKARYDFWPFFGVRWRPGYIRHFTLWPIERYEQRDDENVHDELFTILPFFQHHSHLDKKTGEESLSWQFWPFMHYRRDRDGGTDFQALSLFLSKNEDLEELILPFTRLYRHREIPALGSKETQLLFGLASWRSVRGEGLTRYDRASFLFGLIQYRRLGNESALRFLYLPEWPKWGGE